MKAAAVLLLLCVAGAAAAPRALLQDPFPKLPNYHSVCVPTGKDACKGNENIPLEALLGGLSYLVGGIANPILAGIDIEGNAHIQFAINWAAKEKKNAEGICLKLGLNLSGARIRLWDGPEFKISANANANGALVDYGIEEIGADVLTFNVQLQLNAHLVPSSLNEGGQIEEAVVDIAAGEGGEGGLAKCARAKINLHLQCVTSFRGLNLGTLFGASCKPSSKLRASIGCSETIVIPLSDRNNNDEVVVVKP